MKLKFDSTLEYQRDAVSAVTDLFEGLPTNLDVSSVQLGTESMFGTEHTELGISNGIELSTEQTLRNLQSVQARNNVPKSRDLVEEGSPYEFPNFSIEMETGTGKTYVYLRTIFELNQLYGLRKFIIVVPSVAIREGVTTSLKLMREHFRGLYDNVAFDSFVYNSKDLSRVRQFAVNNEIQIMVINIQAFAKDAEKAGNVIHQEQDRMSGRKPIDFVRATKPVVIIDEPQSVDTTPKSQKAITGLNPLLCLRYSATHVHPYNLLYQLDPIRAYDLKLVKQIEVVDANPAQDFNRTMVRLDWIGYPGKSKTPQAKVTIFEDTPNGPREKPVTLKHGADLSQFTNRPDYDGFLDYAKGLQADIEKAIDPDGNFRFGRVPKLAFTPLLNAAGTAQISQEESEKLWTHLVTKGFLDKNGDFLPTFRPTAEGFTLDLPEELSAVGFEASVIGRMNRFVPREFVKNGRSREPLKYNKRVELNPEFQALWSKISGKTRYSVEFKTDELVAKAVAKIKEMAEIKPVRIEVTKRSVELTESGVGGGRITSNRTYVVSNEQPLPDILAFLQRETELTRGTLVRILKDSGRLKDFGTNPQAFMTECAKYINRALHELIVDGIKYEPIAGQAYEMRLFEESEVEEYLDRLYAVKEKNDTLSDGTEVPRTPYDWIAYDSDVEREVAERLDGDPRVKFFCKLPRGFKVPTPIGNYNPDWAIVLEDDGKLYLVRETKSTLDTDKLRDSENRKIKCGKAHFGALGVDFKAATNIHEVLEPSNA